MFVIGHPSKSDEQLQVSCCYFVDVAVVLSVIDMLLVICLCVRLCVLLGVGEHPGRNY